MATRPLRSRRPRLPWRRVVAFLAVLLPAATARAEPPRVGDGTGALPALAGVAVPGPLRDRGAVFAAASYGYTEPVLGTGDRHRRVAGSAAASLTLVDWLAVALRLDGRYDAHENGPNGSDDGWVGDPRLVLRASSSGPRGPWLGAQVTAWAPGAHAPSLVAEALSFDFVALAALPVSRWVLAVNAGFRLDRSEASLPDRDTLSRADRLGWGASDSNAILTGVGARVQATRSLELLAEGRWDVLVGADAPPALESPLRFAAGARWALSRRVAALGLVEIGASARAPVGAGEPLVPTEPRVSVLLGLGLSLDAPPPVAVRARPRPPVPVRPPPPVVETPASIQGHVTTLSGTPIPGARVRVESAGGAVDVTTDASGAYAVPGLRAGAVTLHFAADGHRDADQNVELGSAEARTVDQALAPALPAGQIRGVISSFSGQPLRATVTVEPLGASVTSEEDGAFQIEVPPGEYRVVVSAPGHETQRRRLRVEDNGVTFLNADLRQEGR